MLLGLDKSDIVSMAKLEDEGYYVLKVGKTVEVTTSRRKNKNSLLLTTSKSGQGKKDAFLLKYMANNKIYFDREYVDAINIYQNYVSCFFKPKTGSLLIGNDQKYPLRWGLLMFSGVLSANGFVESRNFVYASPSLKRERVLQDVQPLAIGGVGGILYGILLIPPKKGFAYGSEDRLQGRGISSVSYRSISCIGWNKYYIEDWFDNSKILAT